MTPEREALIERYRDACMALKRAEVGKRFVETLLAEDIGPALGIDGGKGLRVSYGTRAGCVTVDARRALDGMVSRLASVVDRDTLERVAAEALSEATKTGEDYRQWSHPQWTRGIEAEMIASLKER